MLHPNLKGLLGNKKLKKALSAACKTCTPTESSDSSGRRLCAEQDFQTNFCSNFPNHCGWHVEVHARPAFSLASPKRARVALQRVGKADCACRRCRPFAAPLQKPADGQPCHAAFRQTPFFCLRNESSALTTSELEVTSDCVVHMIAPGTVLKGRWRIARKIGQGDDFPCLDALYTCF